jgi:hypothetical protein
MGDSARRVHCTRAPVVHIFLVLGGLYLASVSPFRRRAKRGLAGAYEQKQNIKQQQREKQKTKTYDRSARRGARMAGLTPPPKRGRA